MKNKLVKIVTLVMAVALLAVAMTSCALAVDKDNDEIAKLKDKGYNAVQDTLVIPIALKLLGVNADSAVTAMKDGESVTIIYFASKDDVDEAWDAVEGYAEKQKTDDDAEWLVQKFGNAIIFGTKQGCTDATSQLYQLLVKLFNKVDELI